MRNTLIPPLTTDSVLRCGGANDEKLMYDLSRSLVAGGVVSPDVYVFVAVVKETGKIIGTIAFYGPGHDIMGE